MPEFEFSTCYATDISGLFCGFVFKVKQAYSFMTVTDCSSWCYTPENYWRFFFQIYKGSRSPNTEWASYGGITHIRYVALALLILGYHCGSYILLRDLDLLEGSGVGPRQRSATGPFLCQEFWAVGKYYYFPLGILYATPLRRVRRAVILSFRWVTREKTLDVYMNEVYGTVGTVFL